MKLYKGSATCIGRWSEDSLYSEQHVTFEDDAGAYDQKDAAGFIRLNALRLRLLARRARSDAPPSGRAAVPSALPSGATVAGIGVAPPGARRCQPEAPGVAPARDRGESPCHAGSAALRGGCATLPQLPP